MATRDRPDAPAVFGAWCANWFWFVMLALALVYLPMLFPDGRLLSRRWLPVAVIGGTGALGVAILGALADTLVVGDHPSYKVDNPIGIEGLHAPTDLPVFVVLEVLFAVGVGGAAASVVVRLRRSRGVECRQLEWFAYTTVLFIGSSMITGVISDVTGIGWLGKISYVLSIGGLVCLPIAVGIAVLKHRLYEIDILINRTLVYGFAHAGASAGVLRGRDGDPGTLPYAQGPPAAAATSRGRLHARNRRAAIAALFNPLRHRIQAFIDRRFFRSKYDARKTLEAFSAKLREETDLEALDAELVTVVRETMQPEHVSLWLCSDTLSTRTRKD